MKEPLSEAGTAWILDVIVGVALIAVFYWSMKFLRYFKRKRRAFKNRYLRLKTRWRVMAIDDETKVSTSSFVLSAYDSLKSHLSDSSNPTLLFVPQFAGSGNAKCVLEREFKAGGGPGQAPKPHATQAEGFLDLKLQNFVFLDAVKELGVKVGGTDFAGVGNFVAGIGKWFNAGLPTLTGSAFENDNRVVVALTCSDASRYATVSAKGSDKNVKGAQEAAEAAVYKMLYYLGHEGSSTRDADAAADLRWWSRELQEYLSGEKKDGEGLSKVCDALADTRRRIALSATAPEYLVDRARMWEAVARFLRNEKDDLGWALELLAGLRRSKGRAGLKHDIYNVAVVSQLVGAGKLESAHASLVELSQVSEPWANLVVFEKVQLLADEAYRKVWAKFENDMRAWKAELLNFISGSKEPSNDDEFGHELRRFRPTDTVVWNAILAAELDCPEPSRPCDRHGAEDSLKTLMAAKEFFASQATSGSGSPAESYLQLARVHLYLRNLKEARKSASDYLKSSNTPTALSAYVEAEATYSDESQDRTARIIRASDLVRPFESNPYGPLQALKNAIAADVARGAMKTASPS